MESMTARESQALALQGAGYKRSEIARELGCSPGAVSIALQRAKAKLAAKPGHAASIADIIADGGWGRLQRFAEAWEKPASRPSSRDVWGSVSHLLPPEAEGAWRTGDRGAVLREMVAAAEVQGYLPESLHRHRAQRIHAMAEASVCGRGGGGR